MSTRDTQAFARTLKCIIRLYPPRLNSARNIQRRFCVIKNNSRNASLSRRCRIRRGKRDSRDRFMKSQNITRYRSVLTKIVRDNSSRGKRVLSIV